MVGSAWRQPYLAELTFGEMFRLVNSHVSGHKLRILEVGCGRGYLSLELARRGHDLLGIDVNGETIKIAKQTMNTDPYSLERGRLEYQVSDFDAWNGADRKFDLVIFNRSLHHIPHHIRRILEQGSWFKSDKKLSGNLGVSVAQIKEEWQASGRKQHLNRFKQMYGPLRTLFEEKHLSWEPYIFWDIITDMRIPSTDTEMAFARCLMAMEKALIERGAINPVLFCFSGENAQN